MDLKSGKQVTSPPPTIISVKLLAAAVFKRTDRICLLGRQVQSDFSSFTKNSTSGLFGYSAGQQENGQKGKTRQQRRKEELPNQNTKKANITVSRPTEENVHQHHDKGGTRHYGNSGITAGMFQKQALNYLKCITLLRVWAYFPSFFWESFFPQVYNKI